MKKLNVILIFAVLLSMFLIVGCENNSADNSDVSIASAVELSEEENSIGKIVIDGVEYGPEITVGDFDINGWKLDVSRDNSVALKKLLNKGSGAVALKCYNDKYTVRVNGNLDYQNNDTFTMDIVYNLLSKSEDAVVGYITELEILAYDFHDRVITENHPTVEYRGLKLGDSYEAVKKILNSCDTEETTLFIERVWKYDNGELTLQFDRETDNIVGITYKITKIRR